MKEDATIPTRVGYYVVGLIDILNQRQELAKWSRLEGIDEAELGRALRSTVGVVHDIREIFQKMVEVYSREDWGVAAVASCMKPGHAEKFLEMEKSCRLGCQHFSDTTVLFARTDVMEGISSLKEVWGMISGAGLFMQYALSRRIAIRGGIEFGVGCELSEGAEIYGHVLASAHHLEQKVAEWPRIVIGPELLAFLRRIAATKPTGGDAGAIATAQLCLTRIVQCSDGHFMVDFFHREAAGSRDKAERRACFRSALDFVVAEWDSFKRCQHARCTACECDKLARRYADLHKYMVLRAPHWT